VGVYPQFKDLCVGGSEETIEFKGGLGAVTYVVSGNVSETPREGASQLVGGFIQTYVTGMSLSGSSDLPEMYAYKIRNNFPISEGSFSLASGTSVIHSAGTSAEVNLTTTADWDIVPGGIGGTCRNDDGAATALHAAGYLTKATCEAAGETWWTDGAVPGDEEKLGLTGDKFWFSESHLEPVTESSWLEETFDGSNKSMGATLVMPLGGAAELTLDDAYVVPQEGAEEIYFGGDAFFGGGEDNNIENNLGKYYSAGGPAGSRERVYVRPVKKNHFKGLWTNKDDWRNSKQKWQIYEPFWKWNKIKSILKFDKKETTTQNDEAEKDANPENTVFNDLYKSQSLADWFNMGTGGPISLV